MRCIFCPNVAPGRWALTVRRVSGEVERVIEPLCPRCDRALRKAGDLGLRLKATGDRWLGGHIGTGRGDGPHASLQTLLQTNHL